MSWIEIIGIHPVGRGSAIKILELCDKIKLPKIAGRDVQLRVYGNTGYSTDIRIHIHWTAESGPEGKSSFGIELGRALSEFGLVNHTLWVEQSESDSSEQIAV